MKRIGIAAGCALVAAGLAAYQRPDEVRVSAHPYTPPPLHLTVQTQLVQLDAVVRDSRGLPVPGLTQSDFEILDEGKPRPIALFSVGSRLHPSGAATVPAPPPAQGLGSTPAATSHFRLASSFSSSTISTLIRANCAAFKTPPCTSSGTASTQTLAPPSSLPPKGSRSISPPTPIS